MNYKNFFKQQLINEMAMDPEMYRKRRLQYQNMQQQSHNDYIDRKPGSSPWPTAAYAYEDETNRMAEDPEKLYRDGQAPIDIRLTKNDMMNLHMAHNNSRIKIPQGTLDRVQAVIDQHGDIVGRDANVANDSASYPTFNTADIPYGGMKKTFRRRR
jgi:hypothetical protein